VSRGYFLIAFRWIWQVPPSLAPLTCNVDFGAVPDTWTSSMPDTNFNAGVMSLTPSLEIFSRLVNETNSNPLPWDAEQGVLNAFFPPPIPERFYPHTYTRTILPMKYNLNIEAQRSHLDQWNDVWPDARIVHFTQAKPCWYWACVVNTTCIFHQSIARWFVEFDEMNSKFGWTSYAKQW